MRAATGTVTLRQIALSSSSFLGRIQRAIGGTIPLPLLAVLLVQSLLSLRLTRTAFQDEALYIYAGHRLIAQLIHGTPTYDNYSSYFSGAPGLYPILAGGLDGLGGLALVRGFSLVCMLAATLAVWWLTNRLFQTGGVFAAALFAVAGPVVFLGHLATFDALALALVAVAAVLAVLSVDRGWPLLVCLAAVLLLAVFSKYAAALFVPGVLALLAIQTHQRHGWLVAMARASTVAVAMSATAAVVVVWLSSDALLQGLQATTLQRHVVLGASRVELARTAAGYVGLLVLLGCAGLAIAWRRHPLLAPLLVLSGLLAPLNHVRIAEATSLQKHVAFGFVFLAPLAGVAVARLAATGERWSGPQFLAAVALVGTVFYTGLAQANQFASSWPDAGELIAVLRTQVRPVTGRYLAEEAEVPRYYLRELVEPYQWSSTYYFDYARRGRRLVGTEAYRAAIADRYFDVIVLRYGPTAGLDVAIDPPLRAGKGYELIARLSGPSSYGETTYWVWRRR